MNKASTITIIEARNYLVKGMQPQIFHEGEEISTDNEGPIGQRRWMVIERASMLFLSQRHKGYERLALVKPTLQGNTLQLEAEGMLPVEVPVEECGKPATAKIWEAFCPVIIHAEASDWISNFMKQSLFFVRKDGLRPVNSIYANEDATVGFADRFPLTILSEATVEEVRKAIGLEILADRFRYNLLLRGCAPQEEHHIIQFQCDQFVGRTVKPCGRCQTINVNQQSGEADLELFEMLKKHPKFKNPHTREAIVAENAVVEQPGTIRVGALVETLEWREEGWNRPYRASHTRKKTIAGTLNAARSLTPSELLRTILRY